jgi:hypothetical protein
MNLMGTVTGYANTTIPIIRDSTQSKRACRSRNANSARQFSINLLQLDNTLEKRR